MAGIRYAWGETSTVKNLFWAPLFEEFIYRACLINVFIESGKYTPTYCVLLTPLFFAISHLHHVFEQQRNQWTLRQKLLQEKEHIESHLEEYVSLKKAMLIALFKLAYTEIFGIYAGFVYIGTGSLWPAIALHSYCNLLGFPSFENLLDKGERLSNRIIAGVLYVIGTIFLFYFFTWFTDGNPWWE